MNDMLWVSFAYRMTPGEQWHFGNRKILHLDPVCDQPDILRIEEMLKSIYLATKVHIIAFRRFEES